MHFFKKTSHQSLCLTPFDQSRFSLLMMSSDLKGQPYIVNVETQNQIDIHVKNHLILMLQQAHTHTEMHKL